jgi:hypothetical protein
MIFMEDCNSERHYSIEKPIREEVEDQANSDWIELEGQT